MLWFFIQIMSQQKWRWGQTWGWKKDGSVYLAFWDGSGGSAFFHLYQKYQINPARWTSFYWVCSGVRYRHSVGTGSPVPYLSIFTVLPLPPKFRKKIAKNSELVCRVPLTEPLGIYFDLKKHSWEISSYCPFKGTVEWDLWTLVFSWINRHWGMIKVSIFSFPIYGEFNELLANSVLLPVF